MRGGTTQQGIPMRNEARPAVAKPQADSRRDFCFVQSKILESLHDDPQTLFTAEEYGNFQDAYDHFNAALFEGSLPQVLITLQRQRGARGYFSAKRFQRRGTIQDRIHELALNPNAFTGRTDEEVLSTLVHEMVHVWQQEYGHPGRGRYHNREWAAAMHRVGLMASATGKPGGAKTGDSVSHYVLEDGRFSPVCRDFLKQRRLVWEPALPISKEGAGAAGTKEVPKSQTRSKFTCPNCGLNAWAKPDAVIDCHRCSEEAGESVTMLDISGQAREGAGA